MLFQLKLNLDAAENTLKKSIVAVKMYIMGWVYEYKDYGWQCIVNQLRNIIHFI